MGVPIQNELYGRGGIILCRVLIVVRGLRNGFPYSSGISRQNPQGSWVFSWVFLERQVKIKTPTPEGFCNFQPLDFVSGA